MASVYANAQVTIAARSARGSDDGLRHLAKDRFRNILVPSTGLYVREYISEFGYGHSVTERFELWPLLSRAWVFQERHLSPRTLGFGPYQMLWQCRRSCHIEEERALLNRSYLQTEPANLVGAWHEVVQDYSQLQITYDSDRLPALAALATKMSEFRRDDIYLAGLWKHTLLRDLQWQTIHGTLQDRCNAHAPSWSWASVKSPVKFSTFFCLPSVELLNISYIPDGPPHMGRSTKASLTLKGKVGTIVSDESKSSGFELSISNPNELKSYTSSLELLSFADYASNIDPTLQPPETFIVLFMASQMEAEYLFTSVSGLILRKTSTAAYERIACFFVSYKGEESSWDTYGAFSFEDESPPGEPADFFACSETPLDKYMSTLPVESVTIV